MSCHFSTFGGDVARQLIAFGRLKLCGRTLSGRAAVEVARQLIAFGRLKRCPRPFARLPRQPVARQLIAFGRLKPVNGNVGAPVQGTTSQDN